MTQNYFNIIAESLKNSTPHSIKMHKVENNFILDIDYTDIIIAIENDLRTNGYVITEAKNV